MNDKIQKKYSEDKRRKYYGGSKNDALYLFRQSLLQYGSYTFVQLYTITDENR
jgi:hypothetical protein